MKLYHVIAFLLIGLSMSLAYSQDYEHSTENINKVEIVSRVSVVLKTHNDPSFLISSKENKRLIKNDSGLKPLFGKDNTGFNVFVEEVDRTLKVESFQPKTAKDLIIYLPETMNISVENLFNNDILITDFKNEIEAKVDNGDVKIINVSGSVIVDNLRGNTVIIFKELNQDSPSSIINSHGDVDITIPSHTKTDIDVSVPRGDLFTDLDLVTVEEYKKEEEKMRPSRNMKSKLNGGGVSMNIVSLKGNIYLRKQ